MDVNAVLGLIDGAIEAWDVSGDAMRWTPDPPMPRSPLAKPGSTPTTSIWVPPRETGVYMVDETHRCTEDTIRILARIFDLPCGLLADLVPSDLSRETDHPSTERGTT
jgi:hypothetical protein